MKMDIFSFLHLSLFVWLLINVDSSFQISCKDDQNRDVDWFIVYKLPTIEKERKDSYLYAGKAYAYMTSNGAKEWTLSSYSIESEASMLGKTWQSYKDAENEGLDIAYLFYNDEPTPSHKGTAAGHLKGYFAFNDESGIWMVHSIPKFGDSERYNYPKSGLKNGQIALCMTYDTSSLNDICHHLLYCNPKHYDYKITDEMILRIDKSSRTLFTKKPAFVKKGVLMKETLLESKGNTQFFAFAKDNQFNVDLYSEILATYLDTNLFVQSWRLGRGANMKPPPIPFEYSVTDIEYSVTDMEYSGTDMEYSGTDMEYSVTDIVATNMTVSNRERGISFISKEDHSKWAISTDSPTRWVCIADLNRMASQKKRGGGAVCIHSEPVWKAFNRIIDMRNSF